MQAWKKKEEEEEEEEEEEKIFKHFTFNQKKKVSMIEVKYFAWIPICLDSDPRQLISFLGSATYSGAVRCELLLLPLLNTLWHSGLVVWGLHLKVQPIHFSLLFSFFLPMRGREKD